MFELRAQSAREARDTRNGVRAEIDPGDAYSSAGGAGEAGERRQAVFRTPVFVFRRRIER